MVSASLQPITHTVPTMPSRSIRSSSLRFALAMLVVAAPAVAAQPARRVATTATYDSAARFLAPALANLVIGGSVSPSWLPDDRFYYRNTTATGAELILVDPARRTRGPAFDHQRVAAALSAASGTRYTATQLPMQMDLSAKADTVFIGTGASRWACDTRGARCAASRDTTSRAAAAGRGGRGGGGGGGGGGRGGALANTVVSPDGKRAAFIRDWNLWVRDVASGSEKQLTTDGSKDFGYATDNAGWASSDRPILLWSPDSRKIATQQQDERNVGDMYLVETRVGHPVLRSWKYPLPGDSVVAMLHRVIIDVDAARVIRLQLAPEYHRAMLGDNISMNDYAWSPDASKLAVASTSRDHKQAVFRVADAATGTVRTVFEETVPTHFESRTGFRVLWPTNEVIWYSQRDDWGHLYLYDLATGKLKNRITSGEGPVSQIARVDEKARTVWFTGMGRETGQDPYFRHLYRVGLDGKGYVSLTPDDGDHAVDVSPSGRYLVDTYSKPDVATVVTLRDASGRVLMPLEKADISKLVATGWKPPIPFSVKSASGKHDLYGQLFRPTNFDSTRKYPIINNPYPGPQSGSVGSRSFTAARGDRQALAELGFIVITLDGTGTPGRSKSFHDGYYGAMGRDNTIPDQVAGMKELARRHPWIDIDRVGIWGHSGGGFITAGAMFRYPDFFDVGIAESGNHDQRQYEDDWGERYQGLLTRNADGTDSYDVEANQLLAKNLKGKLLLAHGLMDNNVPPYNTWLVVDALIKANKDFDLLMFPYAAHGYGAASSYMMRRRWDYFVTWLLDAQPPKEYEFRSAPGGRGGGPG